MTKGPDRSNALRMPRQRPVIFAILLLLLITSALSCLGVGTRDATRDWRTFDGRSFEVDRVIDGDTLDLRIDGRTVQRVRLIGIDTPETGEYWGAEATAALRQRTTGKRIVVRLDEVAQRDRYDRLLAYLYVSDSELLNQSLVTSGNAFAYRPYKHRLWRQFERSENEARSSKRGLWKDIMPSQLPEWRKKWFAGKN